MPYSERQLRRILGDEREAVVLPGRMDHLGLRVTESYVRRQLYTQHDQAIVSQWDIFDSAYRDVREYGLSLRDQMGLGETLGQTPDDLYWQAAMVLYLSDRMRQAGVQAAQDALTRAGVAWETGYLGKAWQLETTIGADTITVALPPAEMVRLNVLGSRLGGTVEPAALLHDLLGKAWRSQYETEVDAMVATMRRSLDTSITNAEGWPKAMQRLRDAVGVDTLPGGVKLGAWRLQTITRTYIMAASNQGMDAVYRDNADLVRGTEWVAAHDGRVCPMCVALDGERWAFDDPQRKIPPMDSHPNCRCTIVPWMSAAMTDGTTPPRRRYDEWLALRGLEGRMR